MKNKWILLLLFLILVTPPCIMWVNNINDKVEIKRIEYIKDKKIECMTKTLMILYGISKWEARYYSIIFFDFSENYKIPWEIYPAIIRIESNFRTNLTSNKKAKGLMQILEPTASEECKLLGIKYINDRTLWNDICNIVIGCNYLSRMIKENGLEDGIKAYLGGPGILKSKNISVENNRYIKEYQSSIWAEYKKLIYTFRGVISESGEDYNKIHPVQDTISIDTKIFSING